jgi:hypothetical protein
MAMVFPLAVMEPTRPMAAVCLRGHSVWGTQRRSPSTTETQLQPQQAVSTGAGKKQIDGPPRTSAKYQTHPPTCRFLFLDSFLVGFWAFLGACKESSKTPQKHFLQTALVKKQIKKTDKNFDVSFFPRHFVFVLSRFWVFRSSSSKARQKALGT